MEINLTINNKNVYFRVFFNVELEKLQQSHHKINKDGGQCACKMFMGTCIYENEEEEEEKRRINNE